MDKEKLFEKINQLEKEAPIEDAIKKSVWPGVPAYLLVVKAEQYQKSQIRDNLISLWKEGRITFNFHYSDDQLKIDKVSFPHSSSENSEKIASIIAWLTNFPDAFLCLQVTSA